MSIDLTGHVAIVTGASSGVGLASVKALLNANASVCGVDISPSPQALANSPRYIFHQCNLTETSAPAEIVKKCTEAFGSRIDILQNVAGIMDTYNSADTVTDESLSRLISVNLTAPIRMMREVLLVMKVQGSGAIVNVASTAGTSGAFAGIAYTASKHGIVGATKNVAWRFKKEGIRCNVINPGGIITNIHKSYDPEQVDEDALSVLKSLYGIQKHVTPESVADVLLFLSSDLSKDINGAVIPVGNALT